MMKKLGYEISGCPTLQTDGCVQCIPVRCIEDTSQGVIPCQEGGQKTEKATRLDDRRVWNACRATLKVADSKKQKCHVEREEEQEKGDGRAEGGNQEDGSKDPPTLRRKH